MSDESDPPIETLIFDVANWPPEERFKVWADHNRGSVFTQAGEGPFAASARIWLLDGIVLSEHRVDAFVGRRDRKLAASAGLDHIMLILPMDGTTRIKGRNVDLLCELGDIGILDYRQPMSTINSRQHGIAVSIRRDLLETRCGPVEMHGRLPRNAETRVLAAHLKSIVPHLSSMRRSAIPVLSRILYDLIAIALPTAESRERWPADRSRLRERVVRHVASVPPGMLSIPTLLREVGTTRATLYRAFRAEGGLLAFDRKRRLSLVHRALIDKDIRSLTEIGASCGFADPANLARLFRRRYGYTMTQLRRLLIIPSRASCADDPVGTYREAVRSLTG